MQTIVRWLEVLVRDLWIARADQTRYLLAVGLVRQAEGVRDGVQYEVEDIDAVAALTTVQAAKLKSSIWFEWIDSDSNPADGLSRDGVEDEWTKKQGWDLVDLGSPDWSYIFHSARWQDMLRSVASI